MSTQNETKAALVSKLRRRNLVILQLSSINKELKQKIQRLEKKIERMKRPPFYLRAWAFIKKTLRVK